MHTLALEIDYPHEHIGWIDCWLTIDSERHHLSASYAFPPFLPFLQFVKAVAGQRFPARFSWDEEGVEAKFGATAIADDNPLVHLKIVHDKSDAPWFDADIERQTVIQAFLPPLLDVSQNFPPVEKDWYTPRQAVLHIQEAILRGIPLRSDIHSPQPVEFTVSGDYKTGFLEGQIFIEVRLDEQEVFDRLLQDTSPFWPQWIVFLEKIAAGDLPAEFEHTRVFLVSEPPRSENDEWHQVVRFRAEPLKDAHNFRLKIYTHWNDEEEFLLLEEVANRQKLVRGFVDSFQRLLRDRYQVCPDSEGKTFDLRTLSLGKLDQV